MSTLFSKIHIHLNNHLLTIFGGGIFSICYRKFYHINFKKPCFKDTFTINFAKFGLKFDTNNIRKICRENLIVANDLFIILGCFAL